MSLLNPLARWLGLLLLWCAACSGNSVAATVQDPAPASTPLTQTQEIPAVPKSAQPAGTGQPAKAEIATFGAGCFWCVEAVLEQLDGVLDVKSGYMGGALEQPSYQAVCSGLTGHAEVVQITFDPSRITFEQLLEWFWRLHDPTTLNRQGNDIGTQYRSAIFWHTDSQRQAAETAKTAKDAAGEFEAPIVTEITKASVFWPADDYHQDYYRNNPAQGYCRAVIAPKLNKLRLKR